MKSYLDDFFQGQEIFHFLRVETSQFSKCKGDTFSRMLDHLALLFFCISCFHLREKIRDVDPMVADEPERVDPQLKPCCSYIYIYIFLDECAHLCTLTTLEGRVKRWTRRSK